MRTSLLLFLFICSFVCPSWAQIPDANGIVYVKKSATGNGSSWANAIGELADALKAAKTNTTIKQIWVAEGTYYPMYSPADNNFGNVATRDNAFLLVKDVQMYGGFAGTETATNQRDTTNQTHKSILSGNIGNVGSNTDNTYHIVIASGDVGTAALNGFTISGGYADGSSTPSVNGNSISNTYGSGIYNNSSSPTLTNVTITSNTATFGGGGIYNYSSTSTLTNVTISGNTTMGNSVGGGIYNQASSPILTNVTILGNSGYYGGGVYNYFSSPILTNVTISGNKATSYGGGIYNEFLSSPKVYNSIIYGNKAGIYNYDENSKPEFYNSIIQGSGGSTAWATATGTNGGNNLDIDPKFVSAPDYNTAPFTGGDYSLQSTSPAIDAGDGSKYTGLTATTTDLADNPRVYRFSTGGIIDMGAYENQSPIKTNSTGVLFVKKGGAGSGNGSSWTNAIGEVADALKAAKTNTAIKQIWVAEGTYYPMYSPADNNFGNVATRDNAFLLVSNVQVYGGFAGTETATTQRDTINQTHKSILSGNIGRVGDNRDNAYHVVVSSSDVGSAALNGFTISGGNANGYSLLSVNGNAIIQNDGGGIYNYSSSPTLTNVTVSGNTATSGGGIYNESSSSPTLTNVTISGNTADGFGGGICNYSSAPTLTNVIISGNTASIYGGGIYNESSSSPTLINVTISGNTAAFGGGGIYNSASSPTLTNVTISGNTAASGGGGIYNYLSSPNLYNSIIYGNSTGISNDGENSKPAFYNSIIQGSGGSAAWIATTGRDNGNNLDVDPKFASAPAASTAPFTTGDYRLQSTSSAINAGDNNRYSSSITTDLAGNPRVYNFSSGGIIDMGAYEYQSFPTNSAGVLFVKKGGAGSASGSSWTNAIGELADALKAAKNNTAIKQIWVAEGTYYPMYSPADNNFGNAATRENAFLLIKDVQIYGGFTGTETATTQRDTINQTHKSILSGDIGSIGNNTDNTYHVVVSSGAVGTAALNGFTISSGNANVNSSLTVNGIYISEICGGGVSNYLSSPTLTNVTISGNKASTYGGGIYNNATNPTLINVTISGNTASTYGGGICNYSYSSPTLTNVTISGNTATNGGGGIYNYNTSSPTLTNCSIAGNTASSYGGGMYNTFASSPTLTNCTFSGNAANSGGGIYNAYSSNPQIHNTLIYGNSSEISNLSSTPIITYSLVQGGYTGAGNISADPLFVNAPAAATAPFTGGDYHIQTGSPAINAGDPSTNNSGYAVQAGTTDLDGNTRIIAARIDMGAYEANETTLPVQIGTFSAVASSKTSLLRWTTLSEANNAGFEVQRSIDGRSFAKIGYVTGAGTTTAATAYSYTDRTPIAGTNYYRLKQVNYDGKYDYTDIRTVDFAATTAITVYPNPVRSMLTVKVNTAGSFVLTDAIGHTVFSQVATAGTTLQVNMSSFASGIYFWQIAEQKGKVVKE